MTNAVEKASLSPRSALPAGLPAVTATAKQGRLTAFNCSCLPADAWKNCVGTALKDITELWFGKENEEKKKEGDKTERK